MGKESVVGCWHGEGRRTPDWCWPLPETEKRS